MPIIRHGSHNERLNLVEKKEDLSQVLGDHATSYWEIFRDFIQAKISKPEFDLAARKVLGKNHITLHNQFVLAILHNARCPVPPPEFAKQFQSARKNRRDLTGGAKKRKPKTSIPSHSVVRKRSLSGVIRIQHILNGEPGNQLPLYPRMLALDKQLVAEPELLILRQRMKTTANDTSVSEVANDGVKLMMQAMKIHLKRIMELCMKEKNGEQRNISKKDLWKVVNNNPQLFKTTSQSHEKAQMLLGWEDARSFIQ